MFSYPTAPVATLLVALATIPAPAQTPLDVESSRVRGGPEVVRHSWSTPLIALRLSAPIPADLPEGAVELLQELARPTAGAAAGRIGADLEMRREPGHAVILLTGPADRRDELLEILRVAVGPPDVAVESLRRARVAAEDRVLEALERAGPRLRRGLRARFLGAPPLSAPALARLGPDAVRWTADRLYDPDRLRVVVVGPGDGAPISRTLAGPVGRDLASARPGADSLPALPPLLDGREWAAVALPVSGSPAAIAVAGELLDEFRRGRSAGDGPPGSVSADAGERSPGEGNVAVEAWLEPGLTALVRIGDGGPEEGEAALRRLVGEAAALDDFETVVRRTARRLRDRLLLDARTVGGRAEIIGRIADLEDRPDAAAALVAALGSLESSEVRQVLETARSARPVAVRP